MAEVSALVHATAVIDPAARLGANVRVGPYCVVGADVEIGDDTILGHLEVCDRVIVTAMSLVTHSIREPGEYSSGTPIMDNRAWRKNAARFRQLDALARRVSGLDKD